jgi:hypothetical protein
VYPILILIFSVGLVKYTGIINKIIFLLCKEMGVKHCVLLSNEHIYDMLHEGITPVSMNYGYLIQSFMFPYPSHRLHWLKNDVETHLKLESLFETIFTPK